MNNKYTAFLFFIFFGCAAIISAHTEDFFSLLYSGSLVYDQKKSTETLINRIDGRFFLPFQSLSLRAELIARNRFKDFDFSQNDSIVNWGMGIYHYNTGSRILYGVLDEWGLPARIRNPWIRAVPFAEYHSQSVSDLKTEISPTKESEAYIFLSSPALGAFKVFSSLTIDKETNAAFIGGLEIAFNKKSFLRAEGFYTEKELPARAASAWFSQKPPLPARDFRLLAGSILFTCPFLSIASDWAFSEASAFGRGVYGNLGARFGIKPWIFSFALDGAGDRYTGRDGSIPGQGFRCAAKVEYYGKKSALFRAGATSRSTALGDLFENNTESIDLSAPYLFDKNSLSLYYRFPSNTKSFFRISHLSFSAQRDSSNPQKIEDKYEAGFGMSGGKARYSLSTAVSGFSRDTQIPYPLPHGWVFHSAKIAGAVSYKIGVFQFGTNLGYSIQERGRWNGSFHITLQEKQYRVNAKVECADFPEKWLYTLSWKFLL